MEPSDVGYCCQYMPEGQCGTLSLSSYFFNNNGYESKTILFPMISSAWYAILLGVMLYVLRIVSFRPNDAITDEDYLEKKEYEWTFRRFTIPGIIHGILVWMLGVSISTHLLSLCSLKSLTSECSYTHLGTFIISCSSP